MWAPAENSFFSAGKITKTPMGQERFADIVFLRLALPGQPERNVGLFLLDRGPAICSNWATIGTDRRVDDAELLSQLAGDFQHRIQELQDGGGERFLASLEEQLSNVLRLSDRETVRISNVREAEIDVARRDEPELLPDEGRKHRVDGAAVDQHVTHPFCADGASCNVISLANFGFQV